jgi:hypothetical protein
MVADIVCPACFAQYDDRLFWSWVEMRSADFGSVKRSNNNLSTAARMNERFPTTRREEGSSEWHQVWTFW